MKLKITFSIFLLIFVTSLSAFAQERDEDPEFGDGTRSMDVKNFLTIDFGTITEETAEKKITIKNTKREEITIESFTIPSGTGVTIADKVIKPDKDGYYFITIYTKYIKEKEFVRYLIVKTKYKKPFGIFVTEETGYKLIGTIEK